jgi:hypothetical protein
MNRSGDGADLQEVYETESPIKNWWPREERQALSADYRMQFDECHASNCLQLTTINVPIATRYYLIKIVASFSPNVVIVCINYDDQNRFEFNLCVLNKRWHVLVTENFDAALLFQSGV